MKIRLFVASVVVLALAASACGGPSNPAQSPEGNAAITEASAKEDMPPPPAKEGDAPAAPAADTKGAENTGAAGGVIKLAAMKVTPAKKGKAVELKEDGTVVIDGKPAAKIKGDSVDSTGGTSMLTVGVDGSLVGNGVKAGFKFEGDDVVNDKGMKLSVGDDGAVTASKDSKTETIAKAEGGAASKRAALILTVLWLDVPANVGAADTTKAPGGKDAKPTSTKPAKK
jgi:hypothetical protein